MPAGTEEPNSLHAHDGVLDRRVGSRGLSWWMLWTAVAFLLGGIFRLINLDSFALTPSEGRLAYQGWSVYRGEETYGPQGVPDIHPLVQLAEAFIFFIAGATDVTARLAPVIFGIGILALVFLLRPVAHRGVTLGMMITLGLSPSLIYFSRTIDPAIFVAFFSLLLVVAIARAGITRSETRLLGWGSLAGIAIAGLIASGPFGISAGLAGLIAIAIAAITSADNARHPHDALGVGARRLVTAARPLLFTFGALLLTLLLLFTRLFSDIDALTGIVDTFVEWGRIIGTRPTTTPTQFFFWATLLYEAVAVVLILVAIVTSPLRRREDSRPALKGTTFAIWFAIALVLQSLSSGREPDQFVLLSLPLALGAGIGLGFLLERVERYRFFTTQAWLIPATVAGLVIGLIAVLVSVARSNDPGVADGTRQAQLEIIIILLLAVVPFSVILARQTTGRDRARRVGWAALLVGVILLGMFGVRSASMLAFERSDDGTELLAQNTSTDGVVAFVDQVTRLSRDLSVGEATLVDPTGRFGLTISIAPEIAHPYLWYFRDFPDVNSTAAAGWAGSDVVIAPTSEAMAEGGFIVQERAQFNRVPPAFEGLETADILSYIWSPSEWYDAIRFLLFRDVIAEPPPVQISIGFSPELSNQVNPSLGPFDLTDSPGRGSALGQFDIPTGIDTTTDGDTIYVVDSVNMRVLRFAADGEFIDAWGGGDDPNLAFASAFNIGPTGLAVSPDDLVYVADTWNHRVVVLDQTGQFVREIGQRGVSTDLEDSVDPTLEPGLFFGPRGIAIHDNEIFVTDTGNERVQVFSSDGTFLRAFGGYGSGPGELIEPVGIAVSDDGTVYVADSGNARLSIFEPDGTPIAQIPIDSWEGQATQVNYLAFGPDGLLYMTAPDAGVVEVFDPASRTVVHTTSGPENNEFDLPLGVAVMPDGELLVTDGELHEVIRFQPELPDLPEITTPIIIGAPDAPEVQATPEG